MDEIVTLTGERFHVLEAAENGDPAHVQHVDPWMRGSFIEAQMNLVLAFYRVKLALHESLPAWLRALIPSPARFWSPCRGQSNSVPHPEQT